MLSWTPGALLFPPRESPLRSNGTPLLCFSVQFCVHGQLPDSVLPHSTTDRSELQYLPPLSLIPCRRLLVKSKIQVYRHSGTHQQGADAPAYLYFLSDNNTLYSAQLSAHESDLTLM